MLRGPKAVTSRVYWKARLESMCGSGALSGAAASGEALGAIFICDGTGSNSFGWASVACEHETSVNIPSRQSNPTNHQGHEGSRRFSAIFSFVLLRVMGGVMVFSVMRCVLYG